MLATAAWTAGRAQIAACHHRPTPSPATSASTQTQPGSAPTKTRLASVRLAGHCPIALRAVPRGPLARAASSSAAANGTPSATRSRVSATVRPGTRQSPSAHSAVRWDILARTALSPASATATACAITSRASARARVVTAAMSVMSPHLHS